MSILKQVIKEYGISENSISPTDRTDKRVETPKALPDKTDKRASVGSVSDRSGFSEKQETEAMAELAKIIEMRKRGQIPANYTSTTTCKHCGPVPIWEGCPPKVLGCPWCFNRHRGLPIPEPK